MDYESLPLSSYTKLWNCSYSIILNCTYYLSTPQVHLLRPGPTISYSGAFLTSAPLQQIVHNLGGTPPFMLWLPVSSLCTLLCGVVPRLPVSPTPGDIQNIQLNHVFLSSPWYAWSPSGVTPPGLSALPPSPLNYHCCTGSPTEPPHYISSNGTALLLLSLPTPSQYPPTTSAISSGSDTPPAIHCCYRQLNTDVLGGDYSLIVMVIIIHNHMLYIYIILLWGGLHWTWNKINISGTLKSIYFSNFPSVRKALIYWVNVLLKHASWTFDI